MVAKRRALLAASHVMDSYPRCRRIGELGLPRESIDVWTGAPSAKPDDVPLRAALLSRFENVLMARSERTGNPADAEAGLRLATAR
jgi:hypothetical protein